MTVLQFSSPAAVAAYISLVGTVTVAAIGWLIRHERQRQRRLDDMTQTLRRQGYMISMICEAEDIAVPFDSDDFLPDDNPDED